MKILPRAKATASDQLIREERVDGHPTSSQGEQPENLARSQGTLWGRVCSDGQKAVVYPPHHDAVMGEGVISRSNRGYIVEYEKGKDVKTTDPLSQSTIITLLTDLGVDSIEGQSVEGFVGKMRVFGKDTHFFFPPAKLGLVSGFFRA